MTVLDASRTIARELPGIAHDLGVVDRAFFRFNPLGRNVVDKAAAYVAEHGRVGEGALPVVVIPGFLNDASDLRGMRYFLRELGFPTEIVQTRMRGTASIFGDAAEAARVGERMMREHGADGYMLVGYSRGGLGIEAMRTRMPDAFSNVASVVYLDSPITPPAPGTDSGIALKALGVVADTISSGMKELREDPSIWAGWVSSRESGLRAAQAARPEFRAVSFQAARQDVVPHALSALPEIDGLASNLVSRGSGGHMIGLGLHTRSNAHLAEVIASLPANVARSSS